MATPTLLSSARNALTRVSRRPRAIAGGVVDIRREPDDASELVTQALLGVTATPLEESANGWTRVRLADYEGWSRDESLATPPRRSERVAVVAVPRAPLFATASSEVVTTEVFATTVLPLTAKARDKARGRAQVALPGRRIAWIAAEHIDERPAEQPFPPRGPEVAIAQARALLGTPYLWGGVTAVGVDCSGLSQLACRAAGVIIPRDADEQYEELSYVVDRASARAGDLIYFAHDGRITHVGIALDNMTLLHASGFGESVIITSLDPTDSEYSARLAGMYAGARRPFSAEAASAQ